MRQTWRWFGPADTVPLAQLPQAGVEGVVSALHQCAPGEVWTPAAIAERQALIAGGADGRGTGLAWEVVESLPVSEAIKVQGPDCGAHLEAYRTSLRHLAAAGLEVICYNFMPILDWTRTELRSPMAHGGTAMRFDLVDFVAFDVCLLGRAGAAEDYPDALVEEARARAAAMDDAAAAHLRDNIVAGLPGANDAWTLEQVRERLATYAEVSPERLRANLIDFLAEVAPLAEALGLRLCCHPDDPPFSLLGLPRVMSSEADYEAVCAAVDVPANGVTLCTGSLGVDAAFDGPGFVRRFGPRIHFAHLRNVTRTDPAAAPRTSFYEAAHLEGDVDMVGTVHALMDEEARRRGEGRADHRIPMRPDHGQDLADDLIRPGAMPGYPLVGRLRGLAELRGVMAGYERGANASA